MPNRLLIIQPSHYRARSSGAVYKSRKRTLVPLTLPYLAALTPPGWDIKLVDEQVSDIDFRAAADLVAITTWTINSFRAYEIATRFRERGIPVILGGPHTFFHADEAANHCDAVAIGEGERLWPVMLADAAAGRLRSVYRAATLPGLESLPLPRYDLLDFNNYRIFGVRTFSVQASRGCPFSCEFCSERFYLGERNRSRPVADVIAEIRETGAKNLLFADSNFAGRIEHAMELMEALIPLKVHWSALWPAYLCTRRDFMDLAKRSGILHVNIGLESIDPESLREMKKRLNNVGRYEEILSNLRRRGISYSLNFIFGWDTETRAVFASTLSFLQRNKVPVAYFNILTPHKGTPFYDRMKAEGRILDIDHIGRWPGIACHIRPANYSAAELVEEVRKMDREFYSIGSMFARLPLLPTRANLTSWQINWSQRRIAWDGDTMEPFDGY